MKPFTFNDTTWDTSAVLEHRLRLIELRDEALKVQEWEITLLLSITIGLLHELAKELSTDKSGTVFLV
jgi:hypothetical protein